MSNNENIHVERDAAIGRHATVGGNAVVRGGATVEHNLRVKGWLEAPNIKDANKGLFAEEEKLRAIYPRPENGWWALVGETLPADIYIAEGGKWIFTGKKGGEINIDLNEYRAALSVLEDDVSGLKDETKGLTDTTKALGEELSNLKKNINQPNNEDSETLTELKQNFDTHLQESEETTKTIKERLDVLESNGTGNMGTAAVLPFAGFTIGCVEYIQQSLPADAQYLVYYDSTHKIFVSSGVIDSDNPLIGGGVSISGGGYYVGGHLREYNEGGQARKKVLFVDVENRLWRFDGTGLVQTGGMAREMVVLTQDEYDALDEPDADTLYYIVEREV